MFAALGLGALVEVLALGRVRAYLTGNGLLTVSAGTFAVASAATVLVPDLVAGLALLVVVGLARVAMISTFNADLQLVLPDWVRARGLAVHVMVFLGAQTAASPLWGIAADGVGVRPAVLLAAAEVGIGALAGLRWPVPAVEEVDPTPVAYRGAAPVVTSPAAARRSADRRGPAHRGRRAALVRPARDRAPPAPAVGSRALGDAGARTTTAHVGAPTP